MNDANLPKLLEQARAADSQTQYERALSLYDQFLEETAGQQQQYHMQRQRLAAWEERGDLLSRLGRQQAALESFQRYRQEATLPSQQIRAQVLIGNKLRDMGRVGEALVAHQEALQLADQHDDEMGQAYAYQGMGGTYFQAGRLEEALACLNQALPWFETAVDHEEQLRTWNWKGMAYARLGQTDKAIDAFEKALRLARRESTRATAIVLGNLGEAYQNLFNMKQALVYHEEALALAESTQLAGDVADLARNLGVDLVYLDRLEEGLAHLHRALAISEETGQAAIKLQTLYSLALAEIEKGEIGAAQAHAEALLQEARQTKSRAYEADALYALGLCHRAGGEIGQATQAWQQASFLAHETEQRWLLWQIHAELAKAAPEAGLAQVHRRIAAEVIEQIAYPIADEEMRQGFLQAPAVQEVLSQTDA